MEHSRLMILGLAVKAVPQAITYVPLPTFQTRR